MTDASDILDFERVTVTSTSRGSSANSAQGWLRLSGSSGLSSASTTSTARSTTRTTSRIAGIPSPARSTSPSQSTSTATGEIAASPSTSSADGIATANSSVAGAVAAGLHQPDGKVSTRTLVAICASLGGTVVIVVLLVVCFLWWRSSNRKRRRVGQQEDEGGSEFVSRKRQPRCESTKTTLSSPEAGGRAAKLKRDRVALDRKSTKDNVSRVESTGKGQWPEPKTWEYRASFVPSTPAPNLASKDDNDSDDGDSNVTCFTPGLGRKRAVSRPPLEVSQAATQATKEPARITPAETCRDVPIGRRSGITRNWSPPTRFSEPKGLAIQIPNSSVFDLSPIKARLAPKDYSTGWRSLDVSGDRGGGALERKRDVLPCTASSSRAVPISTLKEPPVVQSPSSVYSPRPVYASIQPAFIRAGADEGEDASGYLQGRGRGDASMERTAETTRTGFSSILRLYTDDGDSDDSA